MALRDIDEGGSRFRLRESFIIEEMGYPDDKDSLFYKALQLGWLNHVGIAAESSTKEKVYAFFHPTFEEYFAALEIADWHFFLDRNLAADYVADGLSASCTNNLAVGNYRIFEPQWKEVILLWLGREDVEKQQKEQFIPALVEFKDGCKDFYWYRAYFLAAAGITEFDYTRANDIVVQIVTWGFGYFNTEKQQRQTFLELIAQRARTALPETDRTLAIAALVELINNSQDESTRSLAASSLGKIDKDNRIAIAALVELINNSQNESTRSLAASSLGKIAKDNPIAISALVELLKNSQDESTRWQAASSLEKIDKDNPIAIAALVELINNSQDESTRSLAASSLGKIGLRRASQHNL